MSLVIEKNIEIPAKKTGKYLVLANEMSVGDSVVVENIQQAHNLGTAFKKTGFRMAMRTIDGKLRVWKVTQQ